jgi:hypothetical protein
MKLQMFGTVGRATVPADTGRHGGRPYDSTRSKFLIRLDQSFIADSWVGFEYRISNKKYRMMKCGIASL